MAKRSKKDLAKAKEAKQKKIAIGGGILLVLLLAYEVPHTMKMLNNHPRPPVVASSTATPASTTTTPASTAAPVAVDPNAPLAAPTLSGSTAVATATTPASSGELVSVVPLKVDQGQLHTFQKMVSKDPFANQAPTAGSGSTVTATTPSSAKGSTGGAGAAAPQAPSGSSSTPSTPPASAAPAPTSAVISVNGVLMGVSVNGTFPTATPVFELKALTATTAKIAIAGGKYANGAGTLTLRLRAPVTLQNTADGSKYVLILEPQGTPVPAPGGALTAASPTSTTSTPVIPSAGSGG